VLRHAYAIGASAVRAGSDFLFGGTGDGRWQWREPGFELDLPLPRLAGAVQLRNAATAIAALRALDLEIPHEAWAEGVAGAMLPARLQRFEHDGVVVDVDVGHNPQAARALARALQASPPAGRTLAVYGALADKDAVGVVTALAPVVDGWHLAGLDEADGRGTDVETFAARLAGTAAAGGARHATVASALAAACAEARPGDRVLAFGSFRVAAAALAWLRARGSEAAAARGV
jgi:dihydrofolate synthase/folylpolyglutamate synthase